jgi:divalent metal cation (Fe/Co/Zn/Cd) transporter
MVTLPTNALPSMRGRLILLQSLTLGWMLIECGVSLVSAARAHSPALLAFGFDSFVELLSASLVVLALAPRFSFNHRRIDIASGTLLFFLAAIVGLTSILALAGKVQPDASPLGIAITTAALLVMPLLAWQKRKLARRTQNNALAADAVQSATCAYLAFITLAGLALNAAFHIAWADSLAALAALPILIVEGRRALRGQSCGCC